jgi:ribonuclease P protein subunit RPR2
MGHDRISKKKFIKKVSQDAITVLLAEAKKNAKKHPKRSKRYVQMAFELAKKHRLRLTPEQRLTFCKKCLVFWVPDKTLKIVFEPQRNAFLIICECGAKRRIVKGVKKT